MRGSSSPKQCRRVTLGSSQPGSSLRRWRVVRRSDSNRTTGYFPVRTQCRQVGLAILLRCRCNAAREIREYGLRRSKPQTIRRSMGVLGVAAKSGSRHAIPLACGCGCKRRSARARIPVEDEESHKPWHAPPSRRSNPAPIREPLPRSVRVVLADEVYVDRSELPPSMVTRLIRLAAFQNPEFYRAQAMRLPTFGKPRVISCASLRARHIGLSRGCLDKVQALLAEHEIVCSRRSARDRLRAERPIQRHTARGAKRRSSSAGAP